VTSLLNKGFHQVAADKAGSSGNKCLQRNPSSTRISTRILEFYLFSSNCQGEIP
jgi:hypothetical protein